MLGKLETEVFAAVKKFPQANARQIWSHLRKMRLAYTTVATTLDRLYKKGYLERTETRKRGGRNYTYTAKDVLRPFTRRIIDDFVKIFGKDALSAFYEELKRR